jgi:transcriptional regulator of heat shock response
MAQQNSIHQIMKQKTLAELLRLVIETYIYKGDPIWSKFLHSLEDTTYAPSTLRKYLNMLEKEWLLYQPYNSAWRIPTVKWLANYLDMLVEEENGLARLETLPDDLYAFDVGYARNDARAIVELLGEYVDGVVVWFLKEDQYYYLGINNLLHDVHLADYETIRYIVKFIESKQLVQELDAKMMKRGMIYYTFLETHERIMSIIYTKVDIGGYDAIVSVLWPARLDHKKNIAVLRQFLDYHDQEYDRQG